MTVLQAILIGLVYYMGSSCWLIGYLTVTRPFIAATLVGIIMGQPVEGAIIGASIQLIYMWWMSVGGSQPSDACMAGTLATALALGTNMDVNVALTLAVPLGVIGSVVWIGRNTFNVLFLHMADKAASKGNAKSMFIYNTLLPQIVLLLITFVPVSLAAYFGTTAVSSVLEYVGDNILGIFGTIGGVLPAVGIALTLKIVMKGGAVPYFFLGFMLTAYLGVSLVGVAAFAVIAAALYLFNHPHKEEGLLNG